MTDQRYIGQKCFCNLMYTPGMLSTCAEWKPCPAQRPSKRQRRPPGGRHLLRRGPPLRLEQRLLLLRQLAVPVVRQRQPRLRPLHREVAVRRGGVLRRWGAGAPMPTATQVRTQPRNRTHERIEGGGRLLAQHVSWWVFFCIVRLRPPFFLFSCVLPSDFFQFNWKIHKKSSFWGCCVATNHLPTSETRVWETIYFLPAHCIP